MRKKANDNILDIELLVLSGGQGTRLASVWADKPKVLAPIAGRPYFDWYVEAMQGEGFQRFCFLLGMGADQVVDHISNRSDRGSFRYLVEDRPLGTGGAIKNAFLAMDEERVFVANGDSYCRFDYGAMFRNHLEMNADCTIGLAYVDDSSDYGSVEFGDNLRVKGFNEKGDRTDGSFVNAGVYLLERRCSRFFPKNDSFSLEREVFQNISDEGRLFGYKSEGDLLDIGTPDRLSAAQSELARLITER